METWKSSINNVDLHALTRNNLYKILINEKNQSIKQYIIIPYFENTREEELVQKMIEEYDKNSIIIVNSINDIKL